MQDNDGNTAAHRAAMNRHFKVVHLLLESDETLAYSLNNKGVTPLNIMENHE